MCRNIRPLFNFDPPATEEEIRAASLQFVRKLTGYNKPSLANEKAFDKAIDEVSIATKKLMNSLTTSAPKKDREIEAEHRKEISAKRFGMSQ